MKVLVLGHSGMLGNAVSKYLTSEGVEVLKITSRWPSSQFMDDVKSCQAQYVVNCIGAIPQRTDEFSINRDLPIWLEENAGSLIVHPGTDCEMDDDEYGVSKRAAAEFIAHHGEKTKIIKTSIIGHELSSMNSLLDWFLNSTGEVFGYTNAYWNGNTTLAWAQECYRLMMGWNEYATCTIITTECLSKFELLNIMKEVYEKEIEVHPNPKVTVNKCLVGKSMPPIRQQLVELKRFYEEKK